MRDISRNSARIATHSVSGDASAVSTDRRCTQLVRRTANSKEATAHDE